MKFCQNVRQFYISVMQKLGCLILRYMSCLIYEIFQLRYCCRGKFESMSGEYQGILFSLMCGNLESVVSNVNGKRKYWLTASV